jgi:hypothetical protein
VEQWLDVLDCQGNPVGLIDFTTEFKYVGSIVHDSLTSDEDVDKRIRPASHNILTNNDIDLKVKESIFVALCLSILLHGSEIQCLREGLFNRLRRIHHRCALAMCRITIAHCICHHILSVSLIERIPIKPFHIS